MTQHHSRESGEKRSEGSDFQAKPGKPAKPTTTNRLLNGFATAALLAIQACVSQEPPHNPVEAEIDLPVSLAEAMKQSKKPGNPWPGQAIIGKEEAPGLGKTEAVDSQSGLPFGHTADYQKPYSLDPTITTVAPVIKLPKKPAHIEKPPFPGAFSKDTPIKRK